MTQTTNVHTRMITTTSPAVALLAICDPESDTISLGTAGAEVRIDDVGSLVLTAAVMFVPFARVGVVVRTADGANVTLAKACGLNVGLKVVSRVSRLADGLLVAVIN